MKKQVIAGLALVPILGSSILLMTACGGGADNKTLSEKMDAAIAAVTENANFSTREINLGPLGGSNYKYYVPKYSGTPSFANYMAKDTRSVLLNSPKKISSTNIKDFYGYFESEREVIAVFYDLPFGVSFNTILNNANIIKNNVAELDTSKGDVSALVSFLDNFISETTDQEREVDRLNKYVSSIKTIPEMSSPLFNLYQNALYNYKKDYQEYVRTTIDLAKQSSRVVEQICPNVSYEEELSTQLANDTVFSFGNKIKISAKEKVQVIEVAGGEKVTYKLRYVDNNDLVWDFTTSEEEYESAKIGSLVELSKDHFEEVTFLGKKVYKDQKVKVVGMTGNFFTAQVTDANGMNWQKGFTTNSNYIQGQVGINKEVALKADSIFVPSGKVLSKGTIISKVGSVESGLQTIAYADGNGFVWEGKVSESKITTVPPTEFSEQFYKLAEDTTVNFKGKKIAKNAKVEVADASSDLSVTYLDSTGTQWAQSITRSQIVSAEKSYYMDISLDIIDDYYSLLVEDMQSKFLTVNEQTEATAGDEYLITITSWMNDYINLMKKVLVHKTNAISKKFNSEDLSKFSEQRDAVKVNENLAREYQTKYNPIQKRFIDNTEFTNEEAAIFRKIAKYYQEILLDWINYYTAKI